MDDFVLFTNTQWTQAPRLRHQVARLLAHAGHRVTFFERPAHPWQAVDRAVMDGAAMRRLAVAACRACEVQGMSRVDFLMDGATGQFFVNEVNTIPGFTSISMYPKMWAHSGIAYSQLLDKLIDLAVERHETRNATRYSK